MITVYEYACLSGHVYKPWKDGYGNLKIYPSANTGDKFKDGWYIMNDHNMPKMDSKLSYYAALYMKFRRGHAIDAAVAIRGTVIGIVDNDITDMISWYSDVFGLGNSDHIPCYMGPIWHFVQNCYRTLKKKYPSIRMTVTGHSLGGALAQLVPLKYFTIPAVVFNSPGCGHIPGIMRFQYGSVHNINSTYGLINKIGATAGELYYIDVPEDQAEAKAMINQFSKEIFHAASSLQMAASTAGNDQAKSALSAAADDLKFSDYYQASEALEPFVSGYHQHSFLQEMENPAVAINDTFHSILDRKGEVELLAKTILAQHRMLNLANALATDRYAKVANQVF